MSVIKFDNVFFLPGFGEISKKAIQIILFRVLLCLGYLRFTFFPRIQDLDKTTEKDFFNFLLQMFLDKQTTKCLVVPQLILADTALIIYSIVFLQLSFNLTVIVKYDGAIPAEIELNKDVPWLHVFTLALSVSGDVLLPGIYNGRNHFTM